MTAQIPAEGAFYRADGSFLGYRGIAATLMVDMVAIQEEGPPEPVDTTGRVYKQRILDGEGGAVLLEIYGVIGNDGLAHRVAFPLTEANTQTLLPTGGVVARDLVHQVGEVTIGGFVQLFSAPFALRAIRRGMPSTVLQMTPNVGMMLVSYAGAPPLSLLKEFIAAGELEEDATFDDLVAKLQEPVAEEAIEQVAAAVADSAEDGDLHDAVAAGIAAVADREGEAIDPGGAIDLREDEAIEAVATREGEAIDAGGAIDLREDQAIEAVAVREGEAIDAGGAIDLRENEAIEAVAVREGEAIDAGGAIDLRENEAVEAVAAREGEAIDAGGAIDLREDEAIEAVATREGEAIDAGGAIDLREDEAIEAVAAREGEAIDAGGAIDLREDEAIEAVAAREGEAIGAGGAIDLREDEAIDAIAAAQQTLPLNFDTWTGAAGLSAYDTTGLLLGVTAQVAATDTGTHDDEVDGAISVTGSITGAVLTVTVGSGLRPGLVLSGANVTAGTRVLSQASGTLGGAGDYALSVASSAASTAIAAKVPNAGVYSLRTGGLWRWIRDNPEETAAAAADRAEAAQGAAEAWADSAATSVAATRGFVQCPTVLVGAREVQPTELSFDLYVQRGVYLDTGEPFDPLNALGGQVAALGENVSTLGGEVDALAAGVASSAGFAQVPNVLVGGREVQPTVLSFDLYVMRGIYTDTGEDYGGPTAELVEDVATLNGHALFVMDVDPIDFGGRQLQPLELSYDLYVLRGIYLDTGEIYEAVSAGAVDLSGQLRVTQGADALMIYRQSKQPGSVYWVGIDYRNTPDPTRVSDVWRIKASAEYVLATGVFTKVRDLTVGYAEWEIAVALLGAVEFMGGGSHGLHEKTDFYVLVDGQPMALDGTTAFRCNSIEPIQASTFKRPGPTVETKWTEPGDVVAEVHTRWRFSKDGLLLQHAIEWLSPEDLILTYMAMVPIIRKSDGIWVSDTAARSPKWLREDASITQASGTAVLTGDAVSSVTIGSGGSDHPGTPTISFSGGGGTGAAATATMTGGVVTGVTITNGGSGYTSAPTVSFSGSPVTMDKADHIRVFGAEGYGAEAKVTKGWDKPNRKAFVTNSASYNKIYFDFTGAYTTSAGEIFETETLIDVFSVN